MLTNKHKSIIKKYQRAAAMPDEEYRIMLRDITGCESSTDPSLTNDDFDLIMPALEVRLELAVSSETVPPPYTIRDYKFWRRRIPRSGMATTRQIHKIQSLWNQLQDKLPDACRNLAYLAAVASKACHKKITDIRTINKQEAFFLTEALKDRIYYADRLYYDLRQ